MNVTTSSLKNVPPSLLLLSQHTSFRGRAAYSQLHYANPTRPIDHQLQLLPPHPTIDIIERLHRFTTIHSKYHLRVLKRVDITSRMGPIYSRISFPIIELSTADLHSKPLIVITAGIHGTETEACYGLCRFIEQQLPTLGDFFSFLIFPVVNPRGAFCLYRGNKRWNLNTTFSTNPQDHCAETSTIIDALSRLRSPPILSIDLHADDAKESDSYTDAPAEFTIPGIYIYEQLRDLRLAISKKALAKVNDKFHVVKDKKIYNMPAEGGVIQSIAGEKKELEGDFESFMARERKYIKRKKIPSAPISLTVEIPSIGTAELMSDMYCTVLQALFEELHQLPQL